ncbi:MAG TPA: hypothetical protein VEC99_09500 [Clostridia bacterium]|nr:hypothetical protein [Clostridia bacterium]
MILHPAILALSIGSLMTCLMIVYAAFYGVRILRHWDLQSGSESQLMLEKKTHLVSTLMSYVFAYQLCSLFLFIFTADKITPLFVGAMCAAGTLNANGYGYPALLLKIINFILGGVWLIINYTDNRGIDYPLIKKKYQLLLLIAPLIVLEWIFQTGYFLKLSPDIITSCCGSTFGSDGSGLGSAFTVFPIMPMKVIFYATMALTGAFGLVFYLSRNPRAGFIFASMGIGTLMVSVASLISFISVYVYELPTHHCPFCILQREYGYVGYFLYLSLLGGAVGSAGVGTLISARRMQSIQEDLPRILRRLTTATLLCYLLFTGIATARMLLTDFRLEGY